MENLGTVVDARLQWLSSLSDEEKTKLKADKDSYADSQVKAQRTQEFMATFNAADTD